MTLTHNTELSFPSFYLKTFTDICLVCLALSPTADSNRSVGSPVLYCRVYLCSVQLLGSFVSVSESLLCVSGNFLLCLVDSLQRTQGRAAQVQPTAYAPPRIHPGVPPRSHCPPLQHARMSTHSRLRPLVFWICVTWPPSPFPNPLQ